MTIHAYPEIYLSRTQAMLGDAFDYAVNCYNIPGTDFVKLLVGSTISKRLENGESSYLTGKSGIEVVRDILLQTMGKAPEVTTAARLSRSAEYWIGWAVAYYQWISRRRYGEIFQAVNFSDLEKLYDTLHEADISKFVDIVDARMKECFADTRLKRLRNVYGCTQRELAERSGVSLRSIQMYEQRNKDINKASAESLLRLAKVLGCTMEDLLE